MSKWPCPLRLKRMVRGFTLRLGFESLADGFCDGVIRFRRGYDALGAGKLNACSEGIQLLHGCGLREPEIDDVRDEWSHAMVAKAAGVNAGRNKRTAECVHLDQRSKVASVAKVVCKTALGETGARSRLHGDHVRVHFPLILRPR